MKHNPYYAPEKLGLTMISFDEPGLSWEYNILCFWTINDGRVFTAQDSGCSCPTPFEDYEAETQEQCIQMLEQVGSREQAETIFDNWNNHPRDEGKLDKCERDEAGAWVKHQLEKVI
jgi:hypothetical protein